MKPIAKRYLGDGVYVAFDGYSLILTAENGISITDTIVLDPDVYASLKRYVNDAMRLTADRKL